MTMICAPVVAESVEDVINLMHRAKEQGADVVEVRLDHLKDFTPSDLVTILRMKPLPVIIACRPEWDGVLYKGEEQTWLELLAFARDLGADYVEIEFQRASEFIHGRCKTRQCHDGGVIVSCFIDGETPSKEDLGQLTTKMRATGGDIIKLVTNARDITELARLFDLLSNSSGPLIAYSINERGLISQLLSPKFGGFLIYGSIEGHAVPGFPSLRSLKETYAVHFVNSDTKVFGLISKPVNHSKGPILHNPSFRHAKLNAVYVPMFVDDLDEFFRTYSGQDFPGFSVGIPYKEAVLRFCDEVDPLARSIGAVNTVIRRPSDGKLIGYNTDCEASITAIEDVLRDNTSNNEGKELISRLAGKEFVVVGAGGAGRALAVGAKSRGARLIIFDIDIERAKNLATAVSGEARPFEDLEKFRPEKGAILANATPIGMHPNTKRIPVSEETVGDYEVVFDAVYTPRRTTLLKAAEAAGAITVSGVEMFLRQAVAQFNLFTGGEEGQAPEELMREIVLADF